MEARSLTTEPGDAMKLVTMKFTHKQLGLLLATLRERLAHCRACIEHVRSFDETARWEGLSRDEYAAALEAQTDDIKELIGMISPA